LVYFTIYVWVILFLFLNMKRTIILIAVCNPWYGFYPHPPPLLDMAHLSVSFLIHNFVLDSALVATGLSIPGNITS
jgi:hypothetical protein